MIVCSRCGFRNPDEESFCRSCAGFLEWSGKRDDPPAEPPPAQPEPVVLAEPVPRGGRIRTAWEALRGEPSGAGAPDRRGGVLIDDPPPIPEADGGGAPAHGLNGSTAPADAEPAAPVETAAVLEPAAWAEPSPPLEPSPLPEPMASPEPPAALEPPVSSEPVTAPTAAAPGPANGKAPAAAWVAPAAVLPGVARPRVVTRAPGAAERTVLPGDLVCGYCGEGNTASRHFCRRCGSALEEALFYEPTRWQAWWLRRRHRRDARRVLLAGQRPRERRHSFGGEGGGWVMSVLTKVLMVAVVALAVLSLVGPYAPAIQSRIKQWKSQITGAVHPLYNPVHPVAASATSSAPGHPAGMAIDNLANTYWATSATNSGIGQTIVITFAKPVKIDRVGFLIGAAGTPQSYLSEPRPEIVHLAFSDGTSTDLSLQDSAKFQAYGVHARAVTSLQLTISAVYPSPLGQNCSIAEIEFFTLKR